MNHIKKLFAFSFTILSLVAITGCETFNSNDPLGSLLSLGQRADAAFTEYQALVAAGQLPADSDVTEAYLEYRNYFALLQTFLKPSATPPPAAIEKAQAVSTAVNAAKSKAKAAKKAKA